MYSIPIAPAGLMQTLRVVTVGSGNISLQPVVLGNRLFGTQRLPSDPIGTFALTLSNVVVGSRVHVEKSSDGTAYHDSVAANSVVVINLSAYAPGSANNDLKIKVRKATGTPNYQPYETQATALAGAGGVFVSQVLDE